MEEELPLTASMVRWLFVSATAALMKAWALITVGNCRTRMREVLQAGLGNAFCRGGMGEDGD